MFKKMLVPLDGSDPSRAGVVLAIGLAKETGGELVFCHVIDLAQAAAIGYPGVDADLVLKAGEDAGRAMLHDAKASAEAAGVKAQEILCEGLRLEALLDVIKQHGIDLVVMGSHGRGGIARAFLGSTTEGVLHHTPVPVLVAAHVRVPAAA